MGLSPDDLKQIISTSGVTGEAADKLQAQLEPHLADQTVYTKQDQRSDAEQRQGKDTPGNLVNEGGQPVQRIFRLPGGEESWGREQRSGSDRRVSADA